MVILRCLFSTRFTLVFFLTFFLFFILYNSVGDDMKKYIGSIVLSIIFGIYLGMFVLNQYKDLNVISVFDYYDSLFFLQSGVYSSEESMKDEMSSFPYYIYDIDDDGYHAYVGITKSKKNALKVKEFFVNMGYDIYIKENKVKNGTFVSVVSQYDLLLDDAEGEAIGDICSQIINSYEELVINENKNEGYTKE